MSEDWRNAEVFVHWHLVKQVWVITYDKRRVVAYADARFVVSETSWRAGFEGTGKRGRRRNVVAWVHGKVADGDVVMSAPERVTFRFFERGDFFSVQTSQTVSSAHVVKFNADGTCVADGIN